MGWISDQTQGGVTVRVWSRPESVAETHFALRVAVDAIDYYASYFGIPYALSKADLLAIPDFAAGAMENWWDEKKIRKKNERRRRRR